MCELFAAVPGRYYASSDVQFGQRTAFTGMLVWQKGHSFSVGSVGSSFLDFEEPSFRFWMTFTSRNTQKAMMTKFRMVVMKLP